MKWGATRTREVLLVALAVTTGVTDATAFERLGHVFASVITGNLVLLGVSLARANGRLALLAGCALAGYALGALVAAPRSDTPDGGSPVWPPEVTVALAIDLAMLCGFALGWELTDGHPRHAVQAVLLGVVAAAMGIQSVSVRRLGQMSTTYLTSTLTGLLESLRNRRWRQGDPRSVGIVSAAFGGAVLATLSITYARRWLPVLQLVPLAAVILVAPRVYGDGAHHRPANH